jgi:hypothetical protein
MKDTLYIAIFALVILSLTSCSAKFDGYDPSTAMVRWILTNDKN